MFTQFVQLAPAHVQAHVHAHLHEHTPLEFHSDGLQSRVSDVITREQYDNIMSTPAPVSARNHIANR